MRPDTREIAIWAGGAFLIVVLLWFYIASRSSDLATEADRLDQQHVAYQQLYLSEEGERLPAAAAIAEMERRLAEQEAHLERSHERSVWPGQGGELVPTEFAGVALGASAGRRIDDYTSALDKVSRVTGRLRQHAESLGMQLPPILPFEGAGELSADDESERALQLARVCAYAALLDLAMEAAVDEVGPLTIDGRPWQDESGAYAAIPVGTVLTCSYASADTIVRSLADNHFGLGIESLGLSLEPDGDYRFALTARLLVPKRDDWQLATRQAHTGARATVDTGRGRTSRRGGR